MGIITATSAYLLMMCGLQPRPRPLNGPARLLALCVSIAGFTHMAWSLVPAQSTNQSAEVVVHYSMHGIEVVQPGLEPVSSPQHQNYSHIAQES
jgi:hypothetical protein